MKKRILTNVRVIGRICHFLGIIQTIMLIAIIITVSVNKIWSTMYILVITQLISVFISFLLGFAFNEIANQVELLKSQMESEDDKVVRDFH